MNQTATPEHALSRSESFDVVIPAGSTAGSIVLKSDRNIAVAEWQAVGWEDLPDGQAGDHVRFHVRVTRLVKPRTVVLVWEGTAEQGDAHDVEQHVIPFGSPVTVTVELLDAPRALQVTVRQHVMLST